MWDIDAQLNGTQWDIFTGYEDEIVSRADAVEVAQAWLDSLSASERRSATIWIREYDADTGAAKGIGEEITV